MEKNQEKIAKKGVSLNIFDPDNPPFQVECVCTYLRELEGSEEEDESATIREGKNRCSQKGGDHVL
jgi:hypothetical protein